MVILLSVFVLSFFLILFSHPFFHLLVRNFLDGAPTFPYLVWERQQAPQQSSRRHGAASHLFRPTSHLFRSVSRLLRYWKLLYHSLCVDIISMAPTTTDIVVFAVWLSWTCLPLTPAALKNGVFAMTLPTLQVLEQLLLGSLKLSKTPGPRNACPLILLHGDTTAAIAIMPPNVSKSSIIISRRKSTSRGWRNRALSSTPLQDLRTFLDFLGLSSSSLRFSSSF